jgi:hypothetical protein
MRPVLPKTDVNGENYIILFYAAESGNNPSKSDVLCFGTHKPEDNNAGTIGQRRVVRAESCDSSRQLLALFGINRQRRDASRLVFYVAFMLH